MKHEDFTTVVIKPSHSAIFVSDFAQQLLEAQKESKVFQSLSKTKTPEASPAKRGRGARGYKGRFPHRGGGGRGQFNFNAQGYQPGFQQQYQPNQWGQVQTPAFNQNFQAQGFGAMNPFSTPPFNTQGGQGSNPNPRGRGRGRGKPT